MEHQQPLNDLKDLAEEEMADKRREVGNEAQTRELYDVPSEPAEDLAGQQEREDQA
jgi:hypothetical protein